MEAHSEHKLGGIYLGQGKAAFRVWAPLAEKVEVHLVGGREGFFPLEPAADGYYETVVEGIEPGQRYMFRLDGGEEFPDPASRCQPEGVHGPSQIVNSAFDWQDAGWPGAWLEDLIIYELHVGTFTPESTFDAIIPRLGYLKELGVTAIEIMPVAQFAGDRNWGYDGVYPFAVQNSYGGPDGLRRLVNACHKEGLAVVLDVVYNHLGAEGNYLGKYGYYFTERYHTGWGSAMNFDGPHSDDVREYFTENTLYWLQDFHVDALRLDAVHAILDFSARSFLEELAVYVEEQSKRVRRPLYLIAESDLNNPRLVRPTELGGYGLDAQWSDDFHHTLHTQLTGEKDGYYLDFVDAEGRPAVSNLAKILGDAYLYSGQYSVHRERRHGAPADGVPAYRFVVAAQNHDQVGNRMMGDRLATLVSFDKLKLAAGLLLLAPFIPLLFMGEEYGEKAPFQYFISHSDPELVAAVREGRRNEFSAFAWQGEPPDPAAIETFQRSMVHPEQRNEGEHRVLFDLYRELIRLRKTVPALRELSKDHLETLALDRLGVLYFRRWYRDSQAFALFNFGPETATVDLPIPGGRWCKQLDSADGRGMGSGGHAAPCEVNSEGEGMLTVPAESFVLFTREEQ